MVSSMRRVEVGSRAEHGSSMSSTFGLDRQRPGDAQALLLAAGEAAAGVAQPVLDLVPEARLGQAALDEQSCSSSAGLRAGELQTGEDVVVDRHRRERVRLLEHHADLAPRLGEATLGRSRCRRRRAAPGRPCGAPGISSCIRLRMRRNVDLPQPDGPISAVTLPGSIDSVTWSSTWCVPNQAVMPTASSPAGPSVGSGVGVLIGPGAGGSAPRGDGTTWISPVSDRSMTCRSAGAAPFAVATAPFPCAYA